MENILIEKQDNIAVITINRPTKLNALNKATIQELHDGFKALNEDKLVKAILITGSGEKAFVAGAEFAYSNKLAYVFFSTSGGMRMQESNFSLMQMPRMIAAINSLKQEKLPFISVCLDPTTGGTTASVALLGDINIAEPKALIAFAGARVIKETVREELPAEFQTAEYLKDKGQIDLVVQRKDLPKVISTLILQLTNKNKVFLSDSSLITDQQQSPLGSITQPPS